MMAASTSEHKIDWKNINIGVLGHVDSGKTSLCKRISTVGSTAAFDSNPQSQQRGITLDLGFSSFRTEPYNITLVDCPGHASLIKTVIGGAQIMDMMLLVLDINKGMQAQTGECLILAEITSKHLIVLLNKIDLVPEDKRAARIAKASKLMRNVLLKTKFVDVPIVAGSAVDNGFPLDEFYAALNETLKKVDIVRDTKSPLLVPIDHCFIVKGQGLVVTGTILQGVLKVNDVVKFANKGVVRVKSIQQFKMPVGEAKAGDRVGVCVSGVDHVNIMRSFLWDATIKHPWVKAAVINLEKISYFKQPIKTNKKYHISLGYSTLPGRVTLFSSDREEFNYRKEYDYVEEIQDKSDEASPPLFYFAVVEFDAEILTIPNSIIIGSDLQTEDTNTCRLAFSGRILDYSEDPLFMTSYLPSIKIVRMKEKRGLVDRIHDDATLIAKGFCKRESKIDYLLNTKVSVLVDGLEGFALAGKIESRFGQTNKVRIHIAEPMTPEQQEILKSNLSKAVVVLAYKKYFFKSDKHKLAQ